MVSLTNSKYIVANSISVIDKHKVIDLKELCLSKLDAVNNIVGLPIETLNSLQKLAESINSDSDFYNTKMNEINLKPDTTYVNNKIDMIINNFSNYDTREQSNVKFLVKI
jgi:ribonuclease PH